MPRPFPPSKPYLSGPKMTGGGKNSLSDRTKKNRQRNVVGKRESIYGSFKLEKPVDAEAGTGSSPYGEGSYLPSFLMRVRTVSVISAPLLIQAWSFSLSMLRVPGLVLGL